MVEVYCEQDGSRYIVSARGHATGSPETCAAVSALLQTLEGWCLNEETVTLAYSRVESGSVTLEFVGVDKAETAYDIIVTGFLRLMATDPELVHVDVCETD